MLAITFAGILKLGVMFLSVFVFAAMPFFYGELILAKEQMELEKAMWRVSEVMGEVSIVEIKYPALRWHARS